MSRSTRRTLLLRLCPGSPSSANFISWRPRRKSSVDFISEVYTSDSDGIKWPSAPPLTRVRINFILGQVDMGVIAETATPVDEADDAIRNRLLTAAAAVFARQGYEGTKIL